MTQQSFRFRGRAAPRLAPARRLRLAALLAGLVVSVPAAVWSQPGGEAEADDVAARVKPALVQVFTIANPADLLSPWQGIGTEKYVGSGTIVAGNRILTNAHLVADHVSVEVKRQGMTRSYAARVVHVGHACDLALLEVEEAAFFADVEPLAVGALPSLQDSVEVYGFPVGGESISVTSGIVSRIEMGRYTHSGVQLLMTQIDAALNPGNSGGPVIDDGKIVGVAVQTLEGAENVGYAVPAPVVQHFLDDIADDRFDGFPTLGVDWQTVANQALRQTLGLESDETGGLVGRINDGSTAAGVLAPGDVLLAIDGSTVAEDLTIPLGPELRVAAAYAVQRKQVGERVELTFARGQRRMLASAELVNAPMLVPGPRYDEKPSYLIFGGLVFQPLTLDYLEFLYEWEDDLGNYAYNHYFRSRERHQVILLSKVLAAPVNRGYHEWTNVIVGTVQGEVPRDMQHLVRLIDAAEGPWLDIVTERSERLVLDLKVARAEGEAILERYGVPAAHSPDLQPAPGPSEVGAAQEKGPPAGN